MNPHYIQYINFDYSKYNNITFIPSRFYRSLPGGPVDIKFFKNTIDNILIDLRRLKNIDGIGFAHLTSKDVVRHKLVREIIDAYEAES